jgi:hypothetical protein
VLPTSEEPVVEILDVHETDDGGARGVAVLALLSDGGLLFDVTSGGTGGSRRFRSLGAWNDRTPRVRFGLVTTPSVNGETPASSQLAALVLTGDPASGRHRLEIMTLPASGDPVALGELSFDVPSEPAWSDAVGHADLWRGAPLFARPGLGPLPGAERAPVLVASSGGAQLIRIVARRDGYALERIVAPPLPVPALFSPPSRNLGPNRRAFEIIIADPWEGWSIRVPTTQIFGGAGDRVEVPLVLSLRTSEGTGGSTASWGAVEPARRGCVRSLPESCRPVDRRIYGNPIFDGVSIVFEVQLEHDAELSAPRVVTTTSAPFEPPPRCEGRGVCSFGRCFCLDAEEGVVAEVSPGSGRFAAIPRDEGELVLDLVPLDADLVLVRSADARTGARFHRFLRREGERLGGERSPGDPLLAQGVVLLQPLGARADGRVAMVVSDRGGAELVRVARVEVSAEGELAFRDVITLGGAPSARDLGLERLPPGLRAAMLPREVYLYALPHGPRVPEDLPVVPEDAHLEVVAVLRRDPVSGEGCPLATTLSDARDLGVPATVISTSEAADCTGLELPVGFMRLGPRRVELDDLSSDAAVSPLTLPWRLPARWSEAVPLSTHERQATQRDPRALRRHKPEMLFQEWDQLIDEYAIGDLDRDGLDDLWIDAPYLDSGRPALRRGGPPPPPPPTPGAAPVLTAPRSPGTSVGSGSGASSL